MAKKSATPSKIEDKDTLIIQPKSVVLGIVIGALLLFLLMAAGARLSGLDIFGLKIDFPSGPSAPSASSDVSPVPLVGISFMTGDWNPRMIDLRTAATEGIHADPGLSLKLFDLQVSVPDTMPVGYVAQAEVYANDSEFIGHTRAAPLIGGKTIVLGDVIPINYKYNDEYWETQEDWKELAVLVNVYSQDAEDVLQSTKTHIKFIEPVSKSWLLSPPYANFVSIVYQVNEEEETNVDFRTILTEGIHVQPRDRLRILELWYHAATDEETKTLFAEGYISTGSYNSETYRQTEKQVFLSGVHELMAGQPFEWTVTSKDSTLILTLARGNDVGRSTILDRYIIPIQ